METHQKRLFGLTTITVAASLIGSCVQQSFKGGNQTRRTGPDSGYATPTTTGVSADSSGGSSATTSANDSTSSSGTTTGSTTASGTSTSTTGTTNPEGPKAKMTIVYDSHESADNSKWKGTYTYKVQRAGEAAITLVSYNSGAKKSSKISDKPICKCGEENTFDLIISAGGKEQNLTTWKEEVIASHAKPTNASDWAIFLEKNLPPAPYTIYVGGFDHEFASNNWCADSPFSCGTRKWNNRDDSMLIFSCNVSECPNGGANTTLKFNGQDN